MMQIKPVSILFDNYVWVAYNPETRAALVVDPGEGKPVLEWLSSQDLRLSAILVTHHHGDHIGGIPAMLSNTKVPVYGPRHAEFDVVTHVVTNHQVLDLNDLGAWEVLEVPGHTAEHVAFYGQDNLFIGDTLFSAGCGRVFDGTLEQLYASLERIRALPEQTQIYCTHEYTLANLAFAQAADPHNQAVAARILQATQLLEQDLPTVPTTLGDEKRYNPFLRASHADLVQAASQHVGHDLTPGLATFMALRRWKDHFRASP